LLSGPARREVTGMNGSAEFPGYPRKDLGRPAQGWRRRLFVIIFESDTRAGRAFDVALLLLILLSVTVVMLDSVASIHDAWGSLFTTLEWVLTAVFTVEYVLRLTCVRHPLRYATSGLGIIDLLAVLPTYFALVVPGLHFLIDVRVLRLLRVFRILKLGAYISEFNDLWLALKASGRKITVFISFVLLVVIVLGTLMYVVEGPENGFTNIPVALYWAITTMTTVGFGDITPHTVFGRFIASVMMLIGWGTLAVPTGIVGAEYARRFKTVPTTRSCESCLSTEHDPKARFCRDCGAKLPPYQSGS
jgi:voltage-gated potassium channel